MKVGFKIHGDALTRIVREVWISDHPKKAIEILLLGLHGITQQQSINIILGRAKLEGINNLDMIPDKVNTFDGHIPLYSIEQMIDRLETFILEEEARYNISVQYYHQLMLEGRAREIPKDYYQEPNKMRENILEYEENLLYLYSLVGKTVADLPLFNIKVAKRSSWMQTYGKAADEREIDKIMAAPFGDNSDLDPLAVDSTVQGIQDTLKGAGITKPPTIETLLEQEANYQGAQVENITETKFHSGYIAPAGDFYGCPDLQHKMLGNDLREKGSFSSDETDSEKALDDLGWLKLSMGRFAHSLQFITQAQFDVIFDYMESENIKTVKFNLVDQTLEKIGKKHLK